MSCGMVFIALFGLFYLWWLYTGVQFHCECCAVIVFKINISMTDLNK